MAAACVERNCVRLVAASASALDRCSASGARSVVVAVAAAAATPRALLIALAMRYIVSLRRRNEEQEASAVHSSRRSDGRNRSLSLAVVSHAAFLKPTQQSQTRSLIHNPLYAHSHHHG